MPTYKVTDPDTGRSVRLTGDSPPTEQELESIFASLPPVAQQTQPAPQQQEPQNDNTNLPNNISSSGAGANAFAGLARNKFGIADDLPPPESPLRVIEPAITVASGAIAEPVAGLAGIAQAINPFADEGAGARAVEATRDFITVQPSTTEGQEGLQSLGETLEPITSALQGVENFAGESVFEATGSPALAAAAKAAPTLIIELLALGGAKSLAKIKNKIKKTGIDSQIEKSIIEAAPQIDQLKEVSRAVYKELDDSGVTLKAAAFNKLVKDVEKTAASAGFNERSAGVLLPKSNSAIKSLKDSVGQNLSLTEIDNLRKEAGIAAKSIEAADAAVGSSVVSAIDDFLDSVPDSALSKGSVDASKVAPKYRLARDLWGRARRAELLNEAMDSASRGASGFENGIVVKFRQILDNKKKRRFFKKDELKALNDVVKGDFNRNLAKLIGKFGFSEGHVTGLIGGSLGVAGGAALGGPIGAVAVPLIGQVSKKLSQRLTRNKADFANQVVRAGSDADAIAAAYIRNTPKSLRSAQELSELLMSPEISLKTLRKNDIIIDAINIAKGNRVLQAVVAGQSARESVTPEDKK